MEKQYRDAFSSPLHTAVITYTYDSMNRLVSENCGDSRISYKYDLSGNRISRDTDGRTENYLYNSRNQLTQLTGDDKNISYTYDPAGNLTEEHSTEHKKIYSYDTYNRNTEITGNDFTQKNHYDAEGYRYSIEENDKVTNFVYRRGIMLAELDEAGNQAKTYTLGNEYAGHVSELNNSLTSENTAASYYVTDEQGSIRYILDQSGEVQNYYQYSAFGETIISEETTPNRLRYNAQTEDELTGLYYLRARYYAPGIGRFTQEDVIYNDGLNLYAYCNSNPVMYSDPSGFAAKSTQQSMCKRKNGGEKDSKGGSKTRYNRTSYQSTGRSNNLFGRDRSTRRTINLTEWRRNINKQNIHDEMSRFLGDDYVKVDVGKWRSLDGTRQFRVKPDDYLGSHGIGQPTVPNTSHVHFEFLVPRSNGNGFDVIKNIHVPISD